MATSNNSNITKRSDVNRMLTFTEMDTNLNEIELVIDDVNASESNIANKVDKSVYNTKMSDVDSEISNINTKLTDTVDTAYVQNIDNRVSSIEDRDFTLEFATIGQYEDLHKIASSGNFNDLKNIPDTAIGITNTETKSGTSVNFDVSKNKIFNYKITASSNITISGFSSGILNEAIVKFENLGSSTITWPSEVRWMKPDGTYTTNTSNIGASFLNSGIDWVIFWSVDNGKTIYAKVMR